MNIQKIINIILSLALLILLITSGRKPEEKQNAEISIEETSVDYTNIPKINTGNHSALYPTPTTVVGTVVKGKINWIAIAHIGNIGFDCLIISMHKSHHSNAGIIENGTLSVNMLSESMLIPADYVGMKSGSDTDKSEVFDVFYGDLKNAPMIKSSPITMECSLLENYETEHHDNFIVRIENTFVSETVLDDKQAIDFTKVKPILFEMPNRSYYRLGEKVGQAWSEGNKYESN